MDVTKALPFALYYVGDAYSTSRKIMGRQVAGKALMKGVSKTWPDTTLRGVVTQPKAADEMVQQLRSDGFKGTFDYSVMPDWRAAKDVGTLYYPAPPAKNIAALRNQMEPSAFSLMGVTHTLSSAGVIDLLADLILPPFQPWDALICTSQAAYDLVSNLHHEMRDYWRDSIGATHFVEMQRPIIPLGIDTQAFSSEPDDRVNARMALELHDDEVAFLFAGRLAFHAKANPAPFYQALEKVASTKPLVCIEAGVFPNDNYRQAYLNAQQALAPSVRFIWVDGEDSERYRKAWQGADIFVSLSDNIQETFGLTPVEAMAAGLPVVVSDWSGYKDTVRDGIDGFRVPTVTAPPGTGDQMAQRYALDIDTYDRYVGNTSSATVVDPSALVQAFERLVKDPALRLEMGAAGRQHAATFDWSIILRRYADFAESLNEIRVNQSVGAVQPWPQREDPFRRFAHFSSDTLNGFWPVRAKLDAKARLDELAALSAVNFCFTAQGVSRDILAQLLDCLCRSQTHNVESLLIQSGHATPIGAQALMWLWKFDLIEVDMGTYHR